MKKVKQTRLISIVLIVAFLATSTIARSTSYEETNDARSVSFVHTKSDTPPSTDHQYPFEEKEKEFEDNSESSDKFHSFLSNFFFICEVTSTLPDADGEFNGISFFNSSGSIATGSQLPIYLSNGAFLI